MPDGIPANTNSTHEQNKLSDSHKHKLMTESGVPPELAEAAGLWTATPDEIFRLTGVRVTSAGVVFPYLGEPDGFVRIRLDQPKDGMKYVSPRGSGCRLYAPPGADLNAPEVVITEGEKKALCAWARGINCFGLGGIDSWRERSATGERLPPDEALLGRLNRSWDGQKVVLVYDSDIGRQHKRWRAFPELAEQLYRLGAGGVRVITLPPLEAVEGKVGLDDYLLAYERAGEDGTARFRSLIEHAPAWLPVGDGAETFAARELASGDVERQTLAAAALLGATRSEPVVLERMKAAGVIHEYRRAMLRRAKEVLAEARERQRRERASAGENDEDEKPKPIVSQFPPAAEVLPEDFPLPPADLEGWRWDIRDGSIVRYKDREDGDPIIRPGLDTVALLTAWLSPVEEGDEEKWELSWYTNNRWERRHFSSGVLFDAKEKQHLIKAGVQINSNNADVAVDWFHALRVLVTKSDVKLPTVRTVSRCGWHKLDGKNMFVLGRTVLMSGGDDAGAAAGDSATTEIEEPEDVEWAGDISPLERQILEGFSLRGDAEKQRLFLLEACTRHPQISFGLGCAAGAPLIRIAQRAGLAPDFSGFTVLMHSADSGRKRHQGKTTWSQVVASFYGNPSIGENGRIRYANRTGVSNGVLLATCADLTVHLDELQEMSKFHRKGVRNEIESFVRMVTQGMDRERGSRGGGGRLTRTFRTVVFATAESDVTAAFEVGGGAHDRVLKLPHLLTEESDANRAEAEKLERFCLKNYGHAGKEYVSWLLRLMDEGKEAEIAAEIENALNLIREHYLPADARRGSAGRMASRAAVGLAGLTLWLEQIHAPQDTVEKAVANFLKAWKMVCDGIPNERIDEDILAVIQGYVSANQEAIYGMGNRPEDRPPAKWVGAKATVQGKECVILFENGLAEEIERRTDMPYKLAREILRNSSLLIARKEGNKVRYTQKIHKGSLNGSGVAIPWAALFPEDEEDKGEEAKDISDKEEEIPL